MSSSQDQTQVFLKLLRPLQGPLETYCRRMLRNRSDVEDVLQSALGLAFAKFDAHVAGTDFKAWMFRIVTYQIFNWNRKHRPAAFGELPADLLAEDPQESVALESTFAAMLDAPDVVLAHFDDVVVDALERLPPLERAVLLLRGVGEFSYQEIHELLSIPVGSVMGYLSRARKRLRLVLADYAAEKGLFRRGPSSGGPHS